jgi:ERCC4-related helicase
LLQLLNESTLDVATLEQDNRVAQFLRGRRNLIELDVNQTKQSLEISKLASFEDKVLVILCLIILKKVNSLLIELGPLAVKCFLLDLKADLLANNSNILGPKRDSTVSAIDDYCQQHLQKASNSFYLDVSDETQISQKIQKLVSILKESYLKDPKLKSIIFVKDRSVAVYLKKLLTGDTSKKNYECLGLLDRDSFKIGFAMGLKRISLINQAYKSTNIKNTDVFKDVLSKIPSCKSIKLSQTEFKETMDNFNQGRINVLIATNVVEEGLDVSTCNLVVCLNELATVKAFI